ncbi:tRNA dihydrouridine(20/20a) synthase DusA [Rhizobiales bacterium]|uniref:tRNA dihydrouridine(20/20a) synthase DusA n=1 Tax=Hongsoonwoonella zoysiae TaxID=2821844 RepID=UPI00156000DE|nr:tRNA dihydrouridine(20/20a) synthase DusA [Hongsoonwoonella zoysiae]NRG18327.1 tRNA dihydrouridine(20/20a) synthase DusA [Hongsoonwoonella zoysiae]
MYRKVLENNEKVFAVAPMMEWTDRHCRVFHRQLSRHTLLYTEMVAAAAVIHGDREKLLGYSAAEHPLACQLGGSDPKELGEAAKIVRDFGYDEVNLNVGCPSDRVQSGRFGACLMREPELVGELIASMKATSDISITLKCRIGVDDQDPEEALDRVADAAVSAGCDAIWVHARKAWLKGLSPKENRDIPPLDYDRVYRLKARLPDVFVGINGGIADISSAKSHLEHMDGVMLGRVAYHDPWVLSGVDPLLKGLPAPVSRRREAIEAFLPYMADKLEAGVRLTNMTRHILGLFHGVPGARTWRRRLTVDAVKSGAGLDVVYAALGEIGADALDIPAPLHQEEENAAA